MPTTAGTPVTFSTTGTLPANIIAGTTYYVLGGGTSTAITVAATVGGAAIVASGAGTPTITMDQSKAVNSLVTALTLSGTHGGLILTNQSLIGAQASTLLDLSTTWNTSGTPIAFKLNITNTASNAAAKAIDVQVGGVTKWSVLPNGDMNFGSTSQGIFSGGGHYSFSGQNGSWLAQNNNLTFGTTGSEVRAPSNFPMGFSSATSPVNGALDTMFSRKAAANLQLGNFDASAPVAQTLLVQSVVAGTTNTAGVNWTFKGSQGTGTGVGGSIIFQIAPAGTTGTAQNALTTALTINTTNITAALPIVTPAATTTISGLNLPHGSAPTAPVNGDAWTTTVGLYVRINGATVGPLSSGGSSAPSVNTVAVGYTDATTTGQRIIIVTATAQTIILPTAVGNQALFTVKFNTTGKVTVACNGAQTIDGGTTAVLLNKYETITLVSDNSNWVII